MYKIARRRALIALSGPGMSYRGPARRDDPAGGTGNDGAGGGGTGGGDGGTGGSGGGTDGGGGTGGDDKGGKTGDDKGGTGGTGGTKDVKIDGDFDADRAKRTIAAAREAERTAKAEAAAAKQRTEAVLKALGLTADGKADPEAQANELKTRAEAAETRARALESREAVRTAAGKHNADAQALLDSVDFVTKVGDLDPSKADFADKVGDLVKEAAKQDRFKATAGTGPRRVGGGVPGGGSGGSNEGRPSSIREALNRRNTT
jgi:hypothetical protein